MAAGVLLTFLRFGGCFLVGIFVSAPCAAVFGASGAAVVVVSCRALFLDFIHTL